jgi:hypothetical protein
VFTLKAEEIVALLALVLAIGFTLAVGLVLAGRQPGTAWGRGASRH